MTDTKEKIIESGISILLEKGYNGTGLKEILDAARVPKGSFYHFFKNKEEFGKEVLLHYSNEFKPVLEQYLVHSKAAPIQRISLFFEAMIKIFDSENGCKGGCLIGNIAQELADVNPPLRAVTQQIMSTWNEYFVRCLEEARQSGELSNDIDTGDLAEFILNSWEGALLKMKITRTVAPLVNFNRQITTYLNCSR